ncbi:UDP-N-acetylmuramyl-tripeptide synthetase [Acidimicrobiaceae bacterium]|nr:UDP-N-acetylmuramyl-tripeptide synthetase [Acidimicrobiaceae bacterium]
MKKLNLRDLNLSQNDIDKFVNSSADVERDSILFIDNVNAEKLNKYVNDALTKNVKKILTSEKCNINNEKILKVSNYEEVLNQAYSLICPDYQKKTYFGITGTNGKTTTGYYLEQILGNNTIFIGTNNENLFRDITNEKHLTSPKLFNILKFLSKPKNRNYENVILEASSHALDQERFKGIKFNTSGFTNLSRDHFDYHKNINNYFEAKLKLFSKNLSDKFVYFDSEWGNKIEEKSVIPSFKIGNNNDSNLRILGEKLFPNINLKIQINEVIHDINLNVTGPKFNLNFLLALSMAHFSEKLNIQNYEENFQNIQNPKGRFEMINYKSNKIVVDYAHTPDAIKTTVDFVTQYFSNVIVIFGAGGDRDTEKRLLMGNATKNADKIIITNDNPRHEDPEKIANDILGGCDKEKTVVMLDRKEAISYGINQLKDNSVLLVLGKGHEMHQEINNKKINFNDFDYISDLLGGIS